MQPSGSGMAHTVMLQPSLQSVESQDAQLLLRVAQRDMRAFEELFNSYHRRLSRFLSRLAPRHDFAEEIINDTFWVVWRRAGSFRGASRVSTWIMGIAYRLALRALREDRRFCAATQPDSVDMLHAAADADTGEVEDWIAQGLRELPDEQRLTLELAYFLGYSCEEIAAITACPVGTVKARMFHAREKLRHMLPSLGGVPARQPS
jgi:RNA polymerase sigma-70 factor (ECF subfamily)